MWDNPEEFEKKIDEYFAQQNTTLTWSGLANYLGFESRQSLEDYKKKEGFTYPIKKALLKIEEIYEKALFQKNAAGPIFALKNFGWRDKQEIDQKTEHSGGINISWQDPKLPDTDDKGSS
jgi:hypothetical protein